MISALEVWALSGQGGAPSLFKTLEGYGQRGHHVDFVTASVGANHHHGTSVEAPPAIEGVAFHVFHLPSLQESRLPVPAFLARVDQKLRFATLFPYLASRVGRQLATQHRYDLIYGYEVHGVLAAHLLRRRLRLPLVARFQGTVMHPYLGRPLSLARKLEETLALRAPADLYVMTDDGTQGDEVLARLNPGSVGKTKFWRNGLDLTGIRPAWEGEAEAMRARLGVHKEDLLLVTATRLARWKRIDRAIDALGILRGRGLPARLVIVGDGEERENLELQAERLGLLSYISFIGAVPQPQVQRYLWAADVFLSLNELSNVGNPLLEAMLSGCCILTLDEGDTRDLMRPDETGELLSSGEPAVIAEALAKLAFDPGRRRRLAEGARRFATANFWSWQDRIDAEVDAVEALLRVRETAHD